MHEFVDIFIDEVSLSERLVLRRNAAGDTMTNVPHYCTHHSPDGYAFGYSGSGPADLALNIAEHFVIEIDDGTLRMEEALTAHAYRGSYRRISWWMHQKLKEKFIAGAEDGTEIEAIVIRDFVQEFITSYRNE